MKEIDEIVHGSYKVTEKEKMLSKLKSDFLNEICKALSDIKVGYKYCEECQEYYREKSWETQHKLEKRNVCTFHDLCEFGEDTYEDRMCNITTEVCPIGHKFEKIVF